jgi:uncharacterized DUF497 family protein
LEAEFDWDEGNRSKCQKHSVSAEEIESLFLGPVMVQPARSFAESRLQAIGKTPAGRHVFLVFTVREREGKQHIRPISARYMHAKEIRHYAEKEAQETSGPQD